MRTKFLFQTINAVVVFFAILASTLQAGSLSAAYDDKKSPTAAQVAQSAIFIYGSRPVLDQIRRNGVERGRITRFTTEGKTEEAVYERRFVRGENLDKDKIRLDQKMPTMEYSLIYGGGQLWGLINGASFNPREDAAERFSLQHHLD